MYVYVAGAITDPDPTVMLKNFGKGMSISAGLVSAGYYPFSPFIDHSFFYTEGGKDITVRNIKDYSMRWLEKCDCVLVIDGWENSKGTIAEINHAKEIGIPVFYNRADLDVFRGGQHKESNI